MFFIQIIVSYRLEKYSWFKKSWLGVQYVTDISLFQKSLNDKVIESPVECEIMK